MAPSRFYVDHLGHTFDRYPPQNEVMESVSQEQMASPQDLPPPGGAASTSRSFFRRKPSAKTSISHAQYLIDMRALARDQYENGLPIFDVYDNITRALHARQPSGSTTTFTDLDAILLVIFWEVFGGLANLENRWWASLDALLDEILQIPRYAQAAQYFINTDPTRITSIEDFRLLLKVSLKNGYFTSSQARFQRFPEDLDAIYHVIGVQYADEDGKMEDPRFEIPRENQENLIRILEDAETRPYYEYLKATKPLVLSNLGINKFKRCEMGTYKWEYLLEKKSENAQFRTPYFRDLKVRTAKVRNHRAHDNELSDQHYQQCSKDVLEMNITFRTLRDPHALPSPTEGHLRHFHKLIGRRGELSLLIDELHNRMLLVANSTIPAGDTAKKDEVASEILRARQAVRNILGAKVDAQVTAVFQGKLVTELTLEEVFVPENLPGIMPPRSNFVAPLTDISYLMQPGILAPPTEFIGPISGLGRRNLPRIAFPAQPAFFGGLGSSIKSLGSKFGGMVKEMIQRGAEITKHGAQRKRARGEGIEDEQGEKEVEVEAVKRLKLDQSQGVRQRAAYRRRLILE